MADCCRLAALVEHGVEFKRRTPDLTEALARLKALEEEILDNDRRMEREIAATYPELRQHSYPAYFDWHKLWRDKIAAIRKAMGAVE